MDWLITVPLGAVLGFLIGLTGVGGGVLVAPSLYVVLGLSYQDAIALSLVYSLLTKIVGTIQHLRQGTVLWKLSLLYGIAGIPGAVAGSHAIYRLGGAGERVFPYVMAGLLLTVAALIVLETAIRSLAQREKPFSPDALTARVVTIVVLVQLVVGALLGVTSVGSGSLVILSMLYLFRMTAQQIVGSNLVIALIMVVPAGLTHLGLGRVAAGPLALLMIGSIAGTVAGARVSLRLPQRTLKLIIVGLILVGAVATIVKAAQTAP